MDRNISLQAEMDSSIKFAKKMMDFFQTLRDDCHDFLQQHKKSAKSSQNEDQPRAHAGPMIKAPKAKRPASPFLLYYSENYHKVTKDHPEVQFTEMMKVMSAKWKELPKSEQEPYIKKFNENQLKYK